MSSPFGRGGGDASYSGIAPDLMKVIEKYNEAADRVAEQTANCSICLNILGAPEGSGQPPRASQLSIITLRCGHRFHEHCLMTWLSPISCPSMEHGLGAVATVLEDRSIIIDLMGQLPFGSNERATVERMAAAPFGRHTVDDISLGYGRVPSCSTMLGLTAFAPGDVPGPQPIEIVSPKSSTASTPSSTVFTPARCSSQMSSAGGLIPAAVPTAGNLPTWAVSTTTPT